jgi:hypothetical protein
VQHAAERSMRPMRGLGESHGWSSSEPHQPALVSYTRPAGGCLRATGEGIAVIDLLVDQHQEGGALVGIYKNHQATL